MQNITVKLYVCVQKLQKLQIIWKAPRCRRCSRSNTGVYKDQYSMCEHIMTVERSSIHGLATSCQYFIPRQATSPSPTKKLLIGDRGHAFCLVSFEVV